MNSILHNAGIFLEPQSVAIIHEITRTVRHTLSAALLVSCTHTILQIPSKAIHLGMVTPILTDLARQDEKLEKNNTTTYPPFV